MDWISSMAPGGNAVLGKVTVRQTACDRLHKSLYLVVTQLAWIALGATPAWAAEPRLDESQLVVLRELRYREGPSKAWTLDLAMTRQRGEKPRPAIVVIHGGGWIEGDKSSFSTTTARAPGNILDFAARGFVAVTINYRLSGEAPFPAALDDSRAAVRWLRAHAKEYHLDPDQVGAYGNSAGGHLALLLAMMPQAKPAAGEPFAEQSSHVQAAASDSGPLDLLAGHRQNQLPVVIEKFLGGKPEGSRVAEYRRASPTSYVGEKLPPLLLIYGEADTQVDVKSADELVASLGRAGHKDVSYFRLAGVDHCPHSLVRIPYLQQVVEEFFARNLRLTAAVKR